MKYPFWMSRDMFNKFLKIFLNDIKLLLLYIKSLGVPKIHILKPKPQCDGIKEVGPLGID